ncbi:borealin-2-like [Acipenser oxyrinchus oxyrinchus]|uniref:Borealin-2-like n=1 Tax=Acipenser oxyrinchus oxyrinchus TaxID=40147 RepID=A0AAD8FYH0_ACIOX|nr:borealin-2-like [Acipenser oxyrinchus oxyrinchus]
MAAKKYRKAEKTEDNTEKQTSEEQRDRKIKLFMQHFENEATKRRNDLETKLEKLVSTVGKAFKVELLKMPFDLQRTKLKNMKIEQIWQAEGVAAVTNVEVFPEIKTRKRKNSKKVSILEESDPKMPVRITRTLSVQCKGTAQKPPAKSRSLASLSSATKQSPTLPRMTPATTRTARKAVSRVAKTQEVAQESNQKTGHKACSFLNNPAGLDHSLAFANIPTSHGQALYLFGDVKNKIDLDLLDEKAVQHMQALMSTLDFICKAKVGHGNGI